MRSLIGGILNRTPQISFAPPGSGGGLASALGLNRNDAEAQMRSMGGVSTLFAIVNRTSNSVAQVNWHLYRKAKSGKVEDREEVLSHACIDLWNQPNPFMPRQEFVEAIQQHIDLTGEGWWFIGRHDRMRTLPLSLWPVRPDRMTPVPDKDDFLSGYVYSSPDGQRVPLELDEVIQLRMPNPLDPYRGMGPVQTLLTDLDSARYTAEWNRNFFRNSAQPGGVIETDRRLGDEEFTELVTRWREQHQGVANAHRVAVIEQGKWVNRTFNMRDMQFTELRTLTRDVILEAFAFPKSELGVTDDVNKAVAFAGSATFALRLVVPRLERIKGALNNDLLPMYGSTAQDLEWDYESPVPADREGDNAELTAKVAAFVQLIQQGVDPDAACDYLGIPRLAMREVQQTPPAEQPGTAVAALVEIMLEQQRTGARWTQTALDAIKDQLAAVRADANRVPRGTCTAGHQLRNVDETDIPTPPEGVPAEDVEAVEAVDLSPVQAAFEAALAGLLATWMGSIVIGWIDDLVDAVRAIVASGNLADLAQLSVDTSDAARELLDAMVDLAEQSAGHVVDEAKDQDVELDPVVPGRDELAQRAETTAAFEGQRYAAAAGKEAARVAGGELTADEVADHVRTHLEELAESSAKAPLAGALTGAQNTARAQTLRSGPVGSLYASEQMDSSTCLPCKTIHGRWICNTDDLTVLFKLYPGSGYINCLGGYYCRGTYVGVWRPEQAKESGA